MDLQKSFTINNCLIKNFTQLSDIEHQQILVVRNSREIREWMYNNQCILVQAHMKFVESLRKDDKKYYWAVYSANTLLGVIYLYNIDFCHERAFLGIYVNFHNTIRRKGIMLIEILKEIAFQTLHLHTIKLEVLEDNIRAINFYMENGFALEGSLKEYAFRDGKRENVLIFGYINSKN